MTDNEIKYWAFLSYSPQDNRGQRPDSPEAGHQCWGDWLHAALQTFSIPVEFVGQVNGRGEIIPQRIEPIFQAEPESPEAATLSAEIRQALEQSICLIVVCSPRSAQSLLVNETVRYFKQLGRGKYILPIVVAGEPHASAGNPPGSSHESFVPALRHPVLSDGTLDPSRCAGKSIFVDARHGVEKREILANDDRNAAADLEMAKIQLIALLLGVGFNGLWLREQKRHFFDLAEAQHQAREALGQVEEARRQTRAAQHQALESQNLPRDVQGQIQTAQSHAQAAQNQAREAERQLQESQNKVRDTQTQLEEARHRALAAEGKILAAEHQAREAQSQLEAVRNQARAAENKILEMQNLSPAVPDQTQKAHDQAQDLQSQLAETRGQVQEAQKKFLAAQSRVQEFQDQARSAQSQLEAARQQAREAQGEVLAAQDQARTAQHKIREIQNQDRNARRLTKIFALLAVLALLTAGLAASIALRQRKVASQALARAAAEAVWEPDLAQGRLDQEQIRQALQIIAGAGQAGNRPRSLDELAVWIPQTEIPGTLKASAVILDDQERSHFQKWLLIRLGWVNPGSAMTCAGAIEEKIVNDEGLGDSSLYFQLAVLDNWMRTDLPGAFGWVCQLPDADARQRALEKIIPLLAAANPQNTLARLNTLQPLPDIQIYLHLFLRWAAHDPEQAIQLRQQLPDQDQADTILCAILMAWVEQQPAVAWNWVQSQPDSASKNRALAACLDELAKMDAPSAVDSASKIMQPRNACWPWTRFLLDSDFGGPMIFPVEAEIFSNTQLCSVKFGTRPFGY